MKDGKVPTSFLKQLDSEVSSLLGEKCKIRHTANTGLFRDEGNPGAYLSLEINDHGIGQAMIKTLLECQVEFELHLSQESTGKMKTTIVIRENQNTHNLC